MDADAAEVVATALADGAVVIAVKPGCMMCHQLRERIGPWLAENPNANVLFVSVGNAEETVSDFGGDVTLTIERDVLYGEYGIIGAPAGVRRDGGAVEVVYGMDIDRLVLPGE